jgi:cytochrome c oxidase assembly factor CtaG
MLMPRLVHHLQWPRWAVVVSLGLWVALPGVALAHGAAAGLGPLTAVTALTSWRIDPFVVLGVVLGGGSYLWAVAQVDAGHPSSRVPRRRIWAWLGGLAVVVVALESSIGVYAEALFSVHMVQHLLLTMVAAPLLALGAPITLLLRVVAPSTRRRVVLPVLHSLPVRVLAFPVVAWVLFSGYMWVVHFSPLFDAALESPVIHQLEHILFLGTAMLFWWPVVGADPAPWRLPHPGRVGYLFLGMPWSSFLGLTIFSATAVLYPHYASLVLDWAPPALADQALAGGIMWAGGDLLFLFAMGLALRIWLRDEDEKGRRNDARLDREAARRGVVAGAVAVPGRGDMPAAEADAAR